MTARARVLVCDDDAMNLEVVRELLQDDYEVAAVLSGEACLDQLSEFGPDVVLLDIMMPGLDGYETCRRIVDASNRNVPQIILVSARTSTEERLTGYNAGADDYLSKPFDHDELRAKVCIHARLRRAIVGLEKEKGQLEAHSNDPERLVHERAAELTTAKEQSESLAEKLAESNTELALLVRFDSLTKLLNRAAWNEVTQRVQEQSQQHQHPYCILMIDIDHFKACNDSNGHGAGDDCLVRVAQAIADQCKAAEFVGRYGGEEFVVLAPETDLDTGRSLAERVRRAVEKLNVKHPASPTIDHVTVSIGVAADTARSWEALLKQADTALYSAKTTGRNRTCATQTTAHAIA